MEITERRKQNESENISEEEMKKATKIEFSAFKAYNEACLRAWEAYSKRMGIAEKAYNEVAHRAWEIYNKETASAWETYKRTIAPIKIILLKAKAKAKQKLKKT
jgi:hypothetical protein